jgi:hypothetical protein
MALRILESLCTPGWYALSCVNIAAEHRVKVVYVPYNCFAVGHCMSPFCISMEGEFVLYLTVNT